MVIEEQNIISVLTEVIFAGVSVGIIGDLTLKDFQQITVVFFVVFFLKIGFIILESDQIV